MNKRKELFFNRIRACAVKCGRVVNEAIDELELYLEYQDTKAEAYRELLPTSAQPEDEVILRVTDEVSGIVSEVNLLKAESTAEVIKQQKKNQGSALSDKKLLEDEEIMKFISKRNDGRWVYRRCIRGQRIYVYGKTQAECLLKVREAQKHNYRSKQQPKISFYAFTRKWLEVFKKDALSPQSWSEYSYMIDKHLKITTPINYITVEKLQGVLNSLPPTRIREKILQIIRPVCKKAYQMDYLKKDISEFLDAGKIQRKTIEAIPCEEQKKIVEKLGDDNFSMRVLFYLLTGARPTEIGSIKPESFKDGYLLIKGTKTEKSVRWVKVSERFTKTFKNKTAEFYKFDNKRFRERLQRFCEALGISDITVYRLRHTFATNLFIMGVPDKERQHYLGHTTTRMTNDVYTSFTPNVKKADIKNIFGDWYPDF